MTREEAIYRLKNMAWLYGSAEREQNIEAINMAIEALSAEETVEIKPIEIKGDFRIDDCIYCSPKIVGNVEVVVRCKDCDNFDHDFNYCNFLDAGVEGEDFFCAYGERREP